MSKVVYLLGAGASYGRRDQTLSYQLEKKTSQGTFVSIGSCPKILEGMPVVNELPGRMEYISSLLWKDLNKYPISSIHRLPLTYFINALDWLQKESARHATIDTFAKKLYLTGDTENYNKLKRVLSVYFTLEQKLNKADKRYDAFFASILGGAVNDFPSNVSIVSWNYDSQIEYAYNEYCKLSSLTEISARLHICVKLTTQDVNVAGFNIFKLNGCALVKGKDASIIDPFWGCGNLTLSGIASTIYNEPQNDDLLLSFAWESLNDKFIHYVAESIKMAEIVVVIGYSFPFFNRQVDRLLFNNMDYLRKIYIQDPNSGRIKQSLLSVLPNYMIDNVAIESVTDTSQFFLPPEL